MQKTTIKKILVVVFIVLLMASPALFYTLFTEYQINQKLKNLSQQGVIVHWEKLKTKYKVPKENAADLYLEAFNKYVPSENSALYNQDPSEKKQKAIFEHLEKNKECLALLYKASQVKDCLFPVREPVEFNDWNVLQDKTSDNVYKSMVLLLLKYQTDFEKKDTQAGFETILSCFALAKFVQKEPIAMQQMHKIHPNFVMSHIAHFFMGQDYFSKEQLSILAEHVQSSEYLEETIANIYVDIAFNIACFNCTKKPLFFFKSNNRYSYEYDKDYLFFLGFQEEIIGLLKRKPILWKESFYQLKDKYQKSPRIANWDISDLIKILKRVEETRMYLVAIAIEQYRIENAKLPENLQQLIPTYLNKIPNSAYIEKPIVYKKVDDGYIVYGLAENCMDDNGKSWSDLTSGQDMYKKKYDNVLKITCQK